MSVNVPPISTANLQSDTEVIVDSTSCVSCSWSALGAQIVAWRCEHIEDPTFVVFVVTDEDRIAVPNARAGEIDLAFTQLDATLDVFAFAYAKVESTSG